MTALLLLVLVGWGLGWLTVRSTIFARPRDWIYSVAIESTSFSLKSALLAFASGVTHCAACAGFWIGAVLSLNRWGLPTVLPGVHPLFEALASGAIVMGFNALADAALIWFVAETQTADDNAAMKARLYEQIAPMIESFKASLGSAGLGASGVVSDNPLAQQMEDLLQEIMKPDTAPTKPSGPSGDGEPH